mgnify:CR=1 FL=1|tara:strand:- start:114 stop:803 length:690 start_codon:yes stop_codon:yes gene_type:complete
MSNVLVIGDTHAPCMLKKYPNFLQRLQDKHKCSKVIHIGDLVDWASISYHEKATGLKDPEREYAQAYKQVQTLYKAFPKVEWLIGNHDALTHRQAMSAGIPERVLKSYTQMWDIPKWKAIPRYDCVIHQNVMYQHGDRGKGGQFAAVKNSVDEQMSVVQGHLHAQAGVWYRANQRATKHGGRTFGAQAGSGCDWKKSAMNYGKKYNMKPLIGALVVHNGAYATWVPMEL